MKTLKLFSIALWIFNACWMWRDYNLATSIWGHSILGIGFIMAICFAIRDLKEYFYTDIEIVEKKNI